MAVNLSRRKSVMGRSIRLGHCVCNPRNPCPCDTFQKRNVCPCAGERMPVEGGPVALTRHVAKPGCASKIGQADLQRVLASMPAVTDPNVLVGSASGDDAGVYRINDTMALVQTVDVFAPAVDDPYQFGQIAAANSLSDVYAMGGKPLTALSIVGYPIEELDSAALEQMLRGGADKLREAGCALIGGHSINDPEIKLGYAVTGVVDPQRVIERGRARDGDVLVLTKSLGTGLVSFAGQIGRASDEDISEIARSMSALNADAAELMIEHHAHACTDVTGFGLAGHLVEMARGSGLIAEVWLHELPIFPSARMCLEQEIIPGAAERNEEYSMAWVHQEDGLDPKLMPIIYDPQTSGGLLVAMSQTDATAFCTSMHRRGHISTRVIGRMRNRRDEDNSAWLVIASNATNPPSPDSINPITPMLPITPTKEHPEMSGKPEDTRPDTAHCCGGEDDISAAPAAAPATDTGQGRDTLNMFGRYMAEANREGQIDKRTKKLIAVALSISQRCKPCLIIHLRGAVEMGIPSDTIHEAAALAIAFAGCPANMLYQEACREVGISRQ